MIQTLLDAVTQAQQTLLAGFFVFLRIGAACFLIPGFGEQMVPVRVRLAMALALSILVFPLVSGFYPFPGAGNLIGLGLGEVATGLLVGIFLRFFVHVLQIAGSIAAQSVSLSQLLGATAADPVPALGQVLVLGGLALALTLGLHVHAISYLALSYDLLPPLTRPASESFTGIGVERVAQMFGLAFALSAPFVIASFIYNLALGVINRAMPQLMVAFVGAPAITAMGLILLLFCTPTLLCIWSDALFRFMEAGG